MKLGYLFSSLALAAAITLPVSAKNAASVEVHYNDWNMPLTGYLEGGTTYVPIRQFFDLLGGSWVTWNDAERSATVRGNTSAVFFADSSSARLAGKPTQLTGKSHISNDTLYVPLRGISQALNCGIRYDGSQRRVTLTKGNSTTQPTDQDAVYWLSRIIEAESGAESYQGKLAVGNVILNRVDNRDFPDSIYGVIFDRKNGVQFTPVANGAIYNTPSAESIRAAEACLSGARVVDDCLYFFNPKTATKASWIIQNRTFYTSIGNHDFYR